MTITSRFDGVVRKLHYDIDEIAQTGDALVDIEIEDGTSSESTKTDDKVEIQEKDAVVVDESGSDNKSKKGNFDLRVNKFQNQIMKSSHCQEYERKDWAMESLHTFILKFPDLYSQIQGGPSLLCPRDHPFKTSACLRGGGVSPFADGQKVTVHKDQKSPS